MRQTIFGLVASASVAMAVLASFSAADDSTSRGEAPASAKEEAPSSASKKGDPPSAANSIRAAETAPFVQKGVAWLVAAQHPDGGWGGGSHADQKNRDPHHVKTDPGTTAFTLLSLLRAGHTPSTGEHKAQIRRGLEYLDSAVEKASADGPRITELMGTQPQSKLGQNVDTPLTAQYLARALELLPKDDPLHQRTDAALDKCLAKLQASQEEDGGWGQGGGWAPVLQSSLGCSALEIAQANGKAIDEKKLAAARLYQKNQVDVTGDNAIAKTEAAAGVELYAFNGALRGNAAEARRAEDAIRQAKEKGKLPKSAVVSRENLRRIGIAGDKARVLAQAAEQNEKQLERLGDEKLLAGFGNNGGEEFLSYLLTSESLLIAGGDKFHDWNDKMHGRLQKIQNADGSWTGHHCITSPVFCTAAVVQCLTTDRDATFLVAMAERTRAAGDDKTEVAQK
jgi:Squalene-hopene cyclase C-terminal domain